MPPEAFFLETDFEVEFDFMFAWQDCAARQTHAARAPSSAEREYRSLGRDRGRHDGRKGGNDDNRLSERRLIGQGHVEPRRHSGRGNRLEAFQRTAGKPQARLPRGQIDDPEIAPEDAAAKPGAKRFGGGFLRCEAPGIARAGVGAALAAATLGFGEDAVEKAVAKAVDRRLDA